MTVRPLVVLLAVSLTALITPAAASATISRTEAEAPPAPAACWGITSWSALSGGAARTCSVANAPLSRTVTVASGQQAVVRFYGYRDGISRGWRIRVDGGAWTGGSLSGAAAPSVLFYTSPTLAAGTHVFDVEYVASGGGFSVDYFETDTSAAATPTCNIAPLDNETAITNAIAGCPNGYTVKFPPNATYHQADKIVVSQRSNLIVDGNGSTFIKTSPSVISPTPPARPNWELDRNTNVTLQNMTIRGAFAGSTPRAADNTTNQWDHGVNILSGDGTTIRNVNVYNVYGEFVTAQPYGGANGVPARHVLIDNLTGQTAKRQCVAPIGVQGYTLQNSHLTDCNQNGVDVEQDVPGELLRDIHIVNNTITGTYFSAITVPQGGNTGDVDGVEIRGNTITQPSDTCYAGILIGETNTVGYQRNVVTANNSVQTLGDGIVYRNVESGSITGNTITNTKGAGYCGPPASLPVRLVNAAAVTVSGNSASGF